MAARGGTRVKMHRSVQTAAGDAYQVDGCYDLPARLARAWIAYGVCSPAPDGAVLYEDEMAAQQAARERPRPRAKPGGRVAP